MTKTNSLNSLLRDDPLVSGIGATVLHTVHAHHFIHRGGLCLIVGLERGAVFLGGLEGQTSEYELVCGFGSWIWCPSNLIREKFLSARIVGF